MQRKNWHEKGTSTHQPRAVSAKNKRTRITYARGHIISFLTLCALCLASYFYSSTTPQPLITNPDSTAALLVPSPTEVLRQSSAHHRGNTSEATGKTSFIFIGMTGIDINAVNFHNPIIASHIDKSAIASMTARSVPLFTCPSEGWMALGVAGDIVDKQGRAAASGSDDPCSPFTVTPLTSSSATSPSYSTPPTPNTTYATTPTLDTSSIPFSFASHSSVPSEEQTSAQYAAHTSPHDISEASDNVFESPEEATTAGDAVIDNAVIDNFENLTASLTWPQHTAYEGAIGVGPGAALTLANSSGHVSQWTDFPDDVDTLTDIFTSHKGNVFVDIGAVRAAPESPEYNNQVAVVMDRLARVLQAADTADGPTANRVQVISSLADPWNRGTLQFVAINVPDSVREYNGIVAGTGVIHSASTRTTGFISLSDLREFLQGTHSSLKVELTDSATRARTIVTQFVEHSYVARQANADWYKAFNLVAGIGVIAALLLFLIRPMPSGTPKGFPRKIWAYVAIWNTWAFSFIAAAFLLNFTQWWHLPVARDPQYSGLIAVGLTMLIAALITLVSLFTSSPVGTIAFITVTILSVDVVYGSLHQRNGFMGSLVLTSRRFYGISNRTYLVLVVAGLLAFLAWFTRESVEQRRRAGIVIAVMGAAVLAVDAVPSWGADFGGPPGIIAAFGVASLLVAGIRLRWWHGIVWLGLTASVMGLVALTDTRQGTTSHIGRFWDSLGTEENFSLIAGKIRDVFRSFTARPTTTATLLTVILLALVTVLVVRSLERRGGAHMEAIKIATGGPYFSPLLLSCAIGIAVAIPINDSGALMLKEGIYIAAPAFIALIAGKLSRYNARPHEMLASSKEVVSFSS